MSQVPYLVSLGLLALILLAREWQNQKTQRELLNRLLVKYGVDPLPEEHPLTDVIKELIPERSDWPPKNPETAKQKKRDTVAVRFAVPGMDILNHMMSKDK